MNPGSEYGAESELNTTLTHGFNPVIECEGLLKTVVELSEHQETTDKKPRGLFASREKPHFAAAFDQIRDLNLTMVEQSPLVQDELEASGGLADQLTP